MLTLSPTTDAACLAAVVGVVLYARVPGAFVDLAAEARWLAVAGAVRLDQHLPPPAEMATSTYLGDQSAVNQALGVLLAGGETLEGAQAALEERARTGRTTTVAAARRILAELEGGSSQEG